MRGHDNTVAKQLCLSLYHTPGFWGIRSQVGKLVALMKAEWRRSRSEAFVLPKLRLRYVQRLPTKGLPLSTVLWQAHVADRTAAASTAVKSSPTEGL